MSTHIFSRTFASEITSGIAIRPKKATTLRGTVLSTFLVDTYWSSYPINTDLALQRCQKLPDNKNFTPVLSKMTASSLDTCQVLFELHPQFTILYMRYLFQDPVVDDPYTVINAIKSMKYGL